MKPVKQTIFGLGGNCFAASIASILELPVEEVPNFMAIETADYWTPMREWLRQRGKSECKKAFWCFRQTASVSFPDDHRGLIATMPSSGG
jgi:predicted subunit of tRNA(5-methylaminomethyl-2-thiouridylate) methyltransferase